jgi:CMP-N-acetylneuraminic acid synthetase/NAD(P)-dependent dehydrogenase (short-subunit alcohol dehydrogenase family)
LKILSIIPARGGSKGIPLKNLAILDGNPLLHYTVKASLESKYITRTIVSTEHNKIKKCALDLGAEVIDRPKKISTDAAKIEPVMENVLDNLRKRENFIPDIVILLQNTSPLRNSNHIDEAISHFIKKRFDSLLSVCESKALVWSTKKDSSIVPLTYDPFNRRNRQVMANDRLLENGAIYISKYDAFRKNRCRISGKIGYYKMNSEFYYEVDSPNDFQIIEGILRRKRNAKEIFSVKNKNIIITGSSGLLGNHYCKLLAKHGANIIMIDHSKDQSLKIKSKFNTIQQKVEFYKCDLSKPKEILNTFKKINKDFKTIDALINNAAFVSAKSFNVKDFKNYEKHPFDLWKKSFEVNVDAVHICCQEVIKIMKKQPNGGSIINVSSNYGLVSPSFETYEDERLWTPPGYAVTKSAILNLTRYIANLYGKQNIRCNTFTPSGVATDKLSKKFVKRYSSKNSLGRMAKVKDYDGPILFLCSDASEYMTGANLIIDGGWTSK